MCSLQYLVAFAAFSIHVTFSWDIAATVKNEIRFYSDKNLNNTKAKEGRDLTALAYDAVYNMMMFVDKNSDNASVFGYFFDTNEYKALVSKRNDNINSIAFDPIERILFWTDDSEGSIFWVSLKSEQDQKALLGPRKHLNVSLNGGKPLGIAVDSCRKYVYWTIKYKNTATIERSRYDGSEREVIISGLRLAVSIAIDQKAKKIYWADDSVGANYVIGSSDLDGSNQLNITQGVDHELGALSVSKNHVYWFDEGFKAIWRIPKVSEPGIRLVPEKYVELGYEVSRGIAAYYSIEDQTEGLTECDTLRNLYKTKPQPSDFASIAPDDGLYCIHGIKDKLACKCSPGYKGLRCDISVCENYCFKGSCNFTQDYKAQCSCPKGYNGERCEIDVCHNYCMNNGKCSLGKNQETICSCPEEYQGLRCEIQKVILTTAVPEHETTSISEVSCNCSRQYTPNANMEDVLVMDSCNEGWNSTRDPIIIVLSVLSLLLCAACGALITKVVKLNKRPRIKKRIIVNKNVTPMTARPEQCEVTIENCCNMNICETPCFEPRSTIRPSLLESKPGKEEKKNLISHMEYPDDY